MGGRTLPAAYSIAVRVENSLIQVGKLAPRTPMPWFPEMSQVPQPSMAPIPIPEKSMQPVASTSYSPSQQKEDEELKALIRNLSNKVISLEKQQ
ncbi:hypothetical protein KI387_032057, partial [Taxus chinensis]